jgi:hypothetical protein
MKEMVTNMERQRAERDTRLRLKKLTSLQVKKDVDQLAKDGQSQKQQQLSTRRELANKVRSETADEVIDGAKKFMFEQRRHAAMETAAHVKGWEAERRANKLKFNEHARKNKDKCNHIESSARLSRKQLQEKRQNQAQELREQKTRLQKSRRAMQESQAALVKQAVNSSASDKFVTPSNSRRMLQHPHYQEVTAVITDVTSHISREIAASPHRRSPASSKISRTAPAALT